MLDGDVRLWAFAGHFLYRFASGHRPVMKTWWNVDERSRRQDACFALVDLVTSPEQQCALHYGNVFGMRMIVWRIAVAVRHLYADY